MKTLKELFEFYINDIPYSIQAQGKPDSKSEKKLIEFLKRKTKRFIREEIEGLIIDMAADYEEQGFMNGFRFTTAIWKEC